MLFADVEIFCDCCDAATAPVLMNAPEKAIVAVNAAALIQVFISNPLVFPAMTNAVDTRCFQLNILGTITIARHHRVLLNNSGEHR